jgi:hypothetical protein
VRSKPIDLPLTDKERTLLQDGLLEWGGSARCTDATAIAMGFDSVDDLDREADRLQKALEAHEPMVQRDWLRSLVATEIVFVSDVLGSGTEWTIVTSWADDETIRLLRSIQKKYPWPRDASRLRPST